MEKVDRSSQIVQRTPRQLDVQEKQWTQAAEEGLQGGRETSGEGSP